MAITFTKKPAGTAKAKVLIMGDYGVGKTHYGLTFPEPLVIDTENALGLFRNRFDFADAHTRSYDEINQLMEQAIANRVPGKTLIVDSITSVYKALQEAHPVDPFMKNTTKKFNKLIDKLYGKVPMHVVMTAWEKAEYAAEGSKIPGRDKVVQEGERIVVGYKVDANQKALFAFDFVFRLVVDSITNRRYAVVLKSRSDKWKKGDEIENPSFADFEGILNGEQFTPIMLNEEAAEIDIAADEREAAAERVVAATVKDNSAPVHGSDEHIKKLIQDYNLIAEEPIRGMSVTNYLRNQGFEIGESGLTEEQREKVIALFEGMIAKEHTRIAALTSTEQAA